MISVETARTILGSGRVLGAREVSAFWGISQTKIPTLDFLPDALEECRKLNGRGDDWILAWTPGLNPDELIGRLKARGLKSIRRVAEGKVNLGMVEEPYALPAYRLFNLKVQFLGCLERLSNECLDEAISSLGPRLGRANDLALLTTLIQLAQEGVKFRSGTLMDAYHFSRLTNLGSSRRLIFGNIGSGQLELHDDWASVASHKLGVATEWHL